MKIILFLAAVFTTVGVCAQVTSLNETFDVTCEISGLNYPAGWSEYHKVADDLLAWTCAPTFGVGSTGCMEINGYYSATNHLDSAWLITPEMDLSSYTGDVFLKFTDKFRFHGDKIALLVSSNYAGGNPDSAAYSWTNVTGNLAPLFAVADSLDWVTHEVSLNSYKTAPFYFAFRYTSSTIACARWDLDNVMTASSASGVVMQSQEPDDLFLSASENGHKIVLNITSKKGGPANVELYNTTGRKCYATILQVEEGVKTYALADLNLAAGIYIIKLSGEMTGYAPKTAKLIVE